jgi:PAS domain S-box-containing protein
MMPSPDNFLSQGDAFLWQPGLVWLNVISDVALVLAYFSIPLSLAWYIRQKKDLDFRWIYLCFAVFIFACGITHLFGIWTIWHPDYWSAGAAKALTAAISLPTAYGLFRLVPIAAKAPGPAELRQVNAALAGEIATRKTAEIKMQELTGELEDRVTKRTAELQSINGELQKQIANRDQARDALQASEELFATAFRMSPDCLVIVRLTDRTVIRANNATCDLWGSTPEKVIGSSTREYSNWENEEERTEFMRILREKGECLNYETDLRLNDGRLARFKISSRLISVNGESCALSIMSDISERRKAEEAAAWLAAIVESSNDAIIGKDLHGTVTSWNAAAEKILGYSAAEIIGRPGAVLMPADRKHEEKEILGRLEKGEAIRSMETVRIGKDGRPVEASVTISPIQDSEGRMIGTSKILRDIGGQKRMEQARRVSDARYRALFEYAPDGILIADARSCYLDANPSICRMLGYSREQLVGLHAADIVLPSEIPNVTPALEAILAKSDYHREWQFRRKDGSTFSAEVIATLMPDGNLLGLIRDVTERNRAESALREKERQLHSSDRRLAEIMHGMTEACFALDENWRFIFVNERCEILLDRKREEMLGRSIWDAFARLIGTPLEEHYRTAMTRRVPVSCEILSPFIGRWLDIRLFPTGEGLAAFLMDIHDRKVAEAELRQSREKFKDLFDNAPTGYHEVDSDGRLVRINHAELKMLGYAEEELVGRYVWELAEHPEISRAAVQAKLGGTPPPEAFERVLKRKDGTSVPVLIDDRLVENAEGKVIGIRAVVQDITGRKQAEEDIRRMNADLERRVAERTAQLESANKELEAFSYSVSHDLRTPLRAVDGFSQAVQEDFGSLLPPAGRHQLQTIRESAQRMGELIDDLLMFSRLSRQSLRRQPVDTEKLVRGVLKDLESLGDEGRIEIRIDKLPSCEGDSALLKQVWVNLISNAFKYTRRCEHPVVEIGCHQQAGENIYFVRDNGTGFDMRYVHKLFGVFQRLHRAEEYEGTGVGLAIVQRVIHRHGGRVWAEAKPNEGAIFQFTLNEGATP